MPPGGKARLEAARSRLRVLGGRAPDGRGQAGRAPAQPGMFFSIPDVGNLLFAPAEKRFFNPVWFPYFARDTHVEELPAAPGLDLAGLPAALGRIGSNALARIGSAGGGGAAQQRAAPPPAGAGVWVFEQPIGFLNISVNIRMTVVRLRDGSLLVPPRSCAAALRLWKIRRSVRGPRAPVPRRRRPNAWPRRFTLYALHGGAAGQVKDPVAPTGECLAQLRALGEVGAPCWTSALVRK